ncbi:MAG: rhomboid family intramembrane serine protease [Luteolibacter sp.]
MTLPTTPSEEEDWVCIGTYPSLDDACDHALVALAMRQAIRINHGAMPGDFDLLAEPHIAQKLTTELQEYTAESHQEPVVPSTWKKHPTGWPYILAWITTLIIVFNRQILDSSISEKYASSSISLIRDHEFWRPFTALFLHADAQHIFGNLATGTIFAALVSKSIGPLKAWALILLSGTLGNAITSLATYPESFVSLGASTAVFGALGILSGTGLIENIRENIAHPWIRTLAPLLAGFVLLGWLGGAAPGSNTDVFGHVFGFAAGVICGATCRFLEKPATSSDPI